MSIQSAADTLGGLLQSRIASTTATILAADDGHEYALFEHALGPITLMLCQSSHRTDPDRWSLVALPSGSHLWSLERLEDVGGFNMPPILDALMTLWESAS